MLRGPVQLLSPSAAAVLQIGRKSLDRSVSLALNIRKYGTAAGSREECLLSTSTRIILVLPPPSDFWYIT